MSSPTTIRWFNALGMDDVATVGGKNASLGEMFNNLAQSGVQVPNGFATTAQAFCDFLHKNQLDDKIKHALAQLDVDDVNALAKTGAEIRQWIAQAQLLPEMEAEIKQAWQTLAEETEGELRVAVRSSATAEDLPEASFAGQQETFLNVCGIDDVLAAVKEVFASLFNDRAIAYRVHQGFAEQAIALSAGIQQMVRSDRAASGVMFTIDTESGFDQVVLINGAYGLGETVVQGAVNPDEFYVYKRGLQAGRPAILRKVLGDKAIKMVFADGDSHVGVETVAVGAQAQREFCLSDADVTQLAQQALLIEQHYGRPMDIEWAKDGVDGKLYIVQARPETVKSNSKKTVIERYELKSQGKIKAEGRSVGSKVGVGCARVIKNLTEMDRIKTGDVLITDMTDPNWEPIMKRAAAIITNRGGRTCHAAIIARELGIPAVVGTNNATENITDGDMVTVSCAEGDTGFVYDGKIDYVVKKASLDNLPKLPVKITMNIGNPERAFDFQKLPNDGVGLARLEFIINNTIGVHPKALLEYDQLSGEVKQQVTQAINGYADPTSFFIDRLREGVATLGAAFYPKPVIVRLSDFKSNEYANLIGGQLYEPEEENPMLGFRGASRYIDESFQDCFAMECAALKQARDEMGLTNIQIMVPFVRTLMEAKAVIDLLAKHGLKRGENELKIIMMCEVPSNALLAEQFLEYFDGFSIGSNDLTQLTLGLDRDSGIVAGEFDERNEAVKVLLRRAIEACNKAGKYIGICGQGPSDYPDFAQWLIDAGIKSLSLNPDSVLPMYLTFQKTEDPASPEPARG